MSHARHHDDIDVPRKALLAIGAILLAALVMAGTARVTGVGRVPVPESTVYEQANLRFEDRGDGAIVVIDAANGRTATVLAPGTNNFVRGVLRGFARDRRAREIGAEPPFALIRWSDGRLSLEDGSTGRKVDLESFGPTNLDSFAKLLAAARVGRAVAPPDMEVSR
jgi:putative photosynthetic complex assembly protein